MAGVSKFAREFGRRGLKTVATLQKQRELRNGLSFLLVEAISGPRGLYQLGFHVGGPRTPFLVSMNWDWSTWYPKASTNAIRDKALFNLAYLSEQEGTKDDEEPETGGRGTTSPVCLLHAWFVQRLPPAG